MNRKPLSNTELRSLAMIGAIVIAALAVSGCAGDLGYARDAAKQANGFVGDMQRTTANAIQAQRGAHQSEQSDVAELKALAEIRKASAGRHVATWQGDDTKASLEIYQAMVDLTKDDDLTKTAPFVIMTPLPEFNAPAVDDKAFTDLMTKLNKLSQRLSPMERVDALIPFVKAAVKAYGDSAQKATTKAKEMKGKEPGTGSSNMKLQEIKVERFLNPPTGEEIRPGNVTDRFVTLSKKANQPKNGPAAAAVDIAGAAPPPPEATVPDTAPVESLMNALQ